MVKVAILLCGHIRTWEKCRDSFKNYFKDLDYDLYIHTYNNVKNYHPYWVNALDIKDNIVSISQNNVKSLLNIETKSRVIEHESFGFTEVRNVEQRDAKWYQHPGRESYDDLQIMKGKGVSIRTYLQYRKLRLCYNLTKSSGVKYDYVIKSRMDLDFSSLKTNIVTLLKMVKPNEILTSANNVQPNDHIFISDSSSFESLINNLDKTVMGNDREYSPHEFLNKLLTISSLSYNPVIKINLKQV